MRVAVGGFAALPHHGRRDIEDVEDIAWRTGFLRKIGYKLGT